MEFLNYQSQNAKIHNLKVCMLNFYCDCAAEPTLEKTVHFFQQKVSTL